MIRLGIPGHRGLRAMSIASTIVLTVFALIKELLYILASEHWNGVLWEILGHRRLFPP